MKPLRLTIEGINSFTSARTVDFEKLAENGIFCICGPTGSGKTTILDCIILALYAPSSHNRGSLKDYINTKCDKGKITFQFTADGKRYEVYRELKRNGSSGARLVNLDTGEVLADRADSVTAAVKAMLKLDKDDFTKVVILEQGKYAEFMSLGKTRRHETVSKLFGLERFEKLKETVSGAKNDYESRIGELEAELRPYKEATEEAHANTLREIKELDKEGKRLEKQRDALEKTVASLGEIRKKAESIAAAKQEIQKSAEELQSLGVEKDKADADFASLAGQREKLAGMKNESEKAHGTLARVAECMKDASEIEAAERKRTELISDYKTADTEVKEAEAEYAELCEAKKAAEAKCAEIESKLKDLGYTLGGVSEAAFAQIGAVADAEQRRISEAEKKLREAKENAENYAVLAEKLFVRANELKKSEERALADKKAFESEYERLRRESAAASLRSGMQDGDTCPVCGGVYHGGESHAVEDEILSAAKQKADGANETLEKIRAEQKRNDSEYSRLTEKLNTAKRETEEYTAACGGKSSENALAAKKLADSGAASAAQCASSEKALLELTAKRAAAETKREQIRQDGLKLKEQIEQRRERINERLGGVTPEKAREQANEIIDSYEKAQKAYEQESERIKAARESIAVREATAKAKIDAAQKVLGDSEDEAFDGKAYEDAEKSLTEVRARISEIAQGIGKKTAEAENLRERLTAKKELTKKKSELEKVAEDIRKLYGCVRQDNKLFAYVADEYMQSFTAAASDTLSELTGGKFTLYYEDGEFLVADFFADNIRRKVKTLSGGETFLASMSIAMAISREIASQNYEFFFLDEGFGTLHERAMETVTQALTKLSRDTVVGIVTHRTELTDGIPSRLTVIPATEDEGSDLIASVQ